MPVDDYVMSPEQFDVINNRIEIIILLILVFLVITLFKLFKGGR